MRALAVLLVACSAAKPSPPAAKPAPVAAPVAAAPVKRGPPSLPAPFDRLDFRGTPESDEAFVGPVDGGVGDCHAFATAKLNDFCIRLDRKDGVLRLVFYFTSLAEARMRVTDAWGEADFGAEANDTMGTPTMEYWYFTLPNGQRVEARLEAAENSAVSLLIRESQTLRDRYTSPAPIGIANVVGMTKKQLEGAFGERLHSCDAKMCRVGMPLLEHVESQPMLKMERGKVTEILQVWQPVPSCVDPAALAEAVAAFGASTPHAVVKRDDLTRHSFADTPNLFFDISTKLPGLCRLCSGRCDDVKLAK